ncbi:MAG: FecR domain-containing protein [Myxococcales bacterium]|nr:FecR domain-containing protein [Myxococcales bacterium]
MSDFARALREAAEDLGAPTPSEAARLDERVAQIGRPQPRRTAPVLALAAIAASLLLFFFLRGEVVSSVSPGLSAAAGRSLPTERALPAPSLPPRFELREASGDADYQDDHGVLAVARGELTLDHPEAAMTLTLDGPARLRPEPWGVTVERGTIRFEVARGKGRREVAVSGGVIEITGTRFVVTEDGRRGKVELEEGSIRFHRGHPRGDETVTPLTPGESLSWQAEAPSDDDAVDTDSSATPAAQPTPSAGPAVSASATPSATPPTPSLIQRVERLRAQGKYREAEQLLAEETEDLDAGTRERLSYERGSLLARQLDDAPAACAHFHQHLATYPDGRYTAEVKQMLGQLHCK